MAIFNSYVSLPEGIQENLTKSSKPWSPDGNFVDVDLP